MHPAGTEPATPDPATPGARDCQCGNVGCLEALAGGRALARDARALGFDARNSRDVVRLARSHQLQVVRLVRESGRELGAVLAGLVNAFDPSVIVIGGDVAEAHEQPFAGVREVVYQRATALATRHLQITRSTLGDRAGTTGAAVLAIEHVLARRSSTPTGSGGATRDGRHRSPASRSSSPAAPPDSGPSAARAAATCPLFERSGDRRVALP